MFKRLGLQALLILIAIGIGISVSAQVTTVGTISGTVRDPKGEAVPNVEVLIEQESTGFSRTVKSDESGFYIANSLPVGRYTVSAAPTGFKKTVAEAFDLHVSENRVVNLDLQVGLVSETVTVTSDAQVVETRSGDVSSLVSQKQITELPLNGRNYSQLALMVPGVSPVTQSGAGGAFSANGTGLNGGVDMSVNGNGSNENLWTVDGVNNMDVGSNRTLLVFPSIDTIQEFRVERNSFSAEYGQAQGAVVNLVTKGGTNEFHGTGFEFFRNSALNANNLFLNKAGAPKGALTYNNFGGNVGGPIWKNKVFFLFSEEWRYENRGVPVSGQVPTAAEKVGDFSGNLAGDPIPINPFTQAAYPGNKIPTASLSPAGLALLSIYPDPNAGGHSWVGSATQPIRTRQDSIRGDANLTSKMNLMVRFINEKWTHANNTTNWGDVPFPTLADDWNQPSKSLAIKLTNTISATAVNDFQFSKAGNDIFIQTSKQSQALVSDITSKFPTVFAQSGNIPSVLWGPGGYTNIWHQAPWQNHEDLYIWKDDFSKVFGSHEAKFGALFSHNIKNEQGNGAAGGNTQAFITGCNGKTGNCAADLLDRNLTLQEYSETDHTPVSTGRWRDTEFYGNDVWKFRKGMTLTLGLRYSQFPEAHVVDGQMSNFVPQFYDGKDYKSGLITPATASAHGLPSSLVKPWNAGWQPRLGFAWDVLGDGKTALRAGFGRYISRSNVIEDVNRMVGNPPWTTTVDTGWSNKTDTLATCPQCRTMDTIGPNLKNQVVGVSPSAGFAAVDINFRPPESYQWNLTISREIFKDTVLEASYIGNHGLHIWRRNVNWNDVAPNQACRGPLTTTSALGCDGSSHDARFQIAQDQRNPTILPGGNSALVAANRRIPTLGPITMSQSTGNSYYDAMQLWLNRRFSRGLAFQGSYTWAHTISDIPLTSFTNSTTDPFNYKLDKGDADLDRRHSFVGNVVYELPSWKNLSPLENQFLGGWQLNAIYSFFGSTPVDVLSGFNTYGTAGNVNPRPNLVSGVPIYVNGADHTLWLNPAAFALPGVGQIGSLGKGSVRGKPINNLDLSINKNWRVKERYGIQFRAEMFNAFNHPNFTGFNNALNLQGDATRPGFGTVTNGSFGTLSAVQSNREIQFGLKFSF